MDITIGINNKNNTKRKNVAASRISPSGYQCDVCRYVAKYKSALDIHLRKHTGDKPYGCKYCDKHFASKPNLTTHLQVHVDEFAFRCAACLEEFDTRADKNAHESKCSARRYVCHICKASFGPIKNRLVIHMRKHSGETPFECPECAKKFSSQLGFDGHMKSHSSTIFHCSRCRKKFIRQNEKDAHEMDCNRKLYTCYICCKSVGTSKSDLVKHVRTHTGEKPYECSHCNKQFNQKSNLKHHVKIHSKNEPFKCSVCRQGFQSDWQRNAHQNNCTRRSFECFLCKMFFDSIKHNLINHLRKHTGERPFKCELCGKGFTSKSYIKIHTSRMHSKKC